MRMLQDYNFASYPVDFLKQYDSDMNFTIDNFNNFFDALDGVNSILDDILYRPRLLTLKESNVDWDMLKLVCDSLHIHDIVFDTQEYNVLKYIIIPDDIRTYYNLKFKTYDIKKLKYYDKIKNISDINKIKDVQPIVYINSDLLSKKSIMRILSQKFKPEINDDLLQYIILDNITENNLNKYIEDFSVVLLTN